MYEPSFHSYQPLQQSMRPNGTAQFGITSGYYSNVPSVFRLPPAVKLPAIKSRDRGTPQTNTRAYHCSHLPTTPVNLQHQTTWLSSSPTAPAVSPCQGVRLHEKLSTSLKPKARGKLSQAAATVQHPQWTLPSASYQSPRKPLVLRGRPAASNTEEKFVDASHREGTAVMPVAALPVAAMPVAAMPVMESAAVSGDLLNRHHFVTSPEGGVISAGIEGVSASEKNNTKNASEKNNTKNAFLSYRNRFSGLDASMTVPRQTPATASPLPKGKLSPRRDQRAALTKDGKSGVANNENNGRDTVNTAAAAGQTNQGTDVPATSQHRHRTRTAESPSTGHRKKRHATSSRAAKSPETTISSTLKSPSAPPSTPDTSLESPHSSSPRKHRDDHHTSSKPSDNQANLLSTAAATPCVPPLARSAVHSSPVGGQALDGNGSVTTTTSTRKKKRGGGGSEEFGGMETMLMLSLRLRNSTPTLSPSTLQQGSCVVRFGGAHSLFVVRAVPDKPPKIVTADLNPQALLNGWVQWRDFPVDHLPPLSQSGLACLSLRSNHDADKFVLLAADATAGSPGLLSGLLNPPDSPAVIPTDSPALATGMTATSTVAKNTKRSLRLFVVDTGGSRAYANEARGPQPCARALYSAALSFDDRLVLFGGRALTSVGQGNGVFDASAASGNAASLAACPVLGDLWAMDFKEFEWQQISMQPAIAAPDFLPLQCFARGPGVVPGPRMGQTSCVFGNMMLMMGGWDGAKVLGDIWLLDLVDWRWTKILPLGQRPSRRCGAASTVLRERWVIHGGVSSDGKIVADQYVLSLRSWKGARIRVAAGGRVPPLAFHSMAAISLALPSCSDPVLAAVAGLKGESKLRGAIICGGLGGNLSPSCAVVVVLFRTDMLEATSRCWHRGTHKQLLQALLSSS